MFAVIKLEKL